MCKETFLRLPEEKRARIVNAAWDEFAAVPFADASINRVIRAAGIPRGSFYQYFEDKSGLFRYLLSQLSGELEEQVRKLLADCGGNLFQAALRGYDRFQAEQRRGNKIPVFDRCVSLVRINPGMDLEAVGRGRRPDKARVMQALLAGVDKAPFRRQDAPFLAEICRMAGMCLFGAIIDCLSEPGQEDERRRELSDELDILRRGSYGAEALRDADAPQGAEHTEGGFA